MRTYVTGVEAIFVHIESEQIRGIRHIGIRRINTLRRCATVYGERCRDGNIPSVGIRADRFRETNGVPVVPCPISRQVTRFVACRTLTVDGELTQVAFRSGLCLGQHHHIRRSVHVVSVQHVLQIGRIGNHTVETTERYFVRLSHTTHHISGTFTRVDQKNRLGLSYAHTRKGGRIQDGRTQRTRITRFTDTAVACCRLIIPVCGLETHIRIHGTGCGRVEVIDIL